MKTIITTMAISGLALLTGCSSALKSNEVHAVNIPVAPYVKLSCNELVREQQLVIAHVQASGVAVDKEHNEDQAAEIVTWICLHQQHSSLKEMNRKLHIMLLIKANITLSVMRWQLITAELKILLFHIISKF